MVCDSSQSAEKEMYRKTLDRNIREGFKYKVKYRLKNLSVKWMSSTVHWQLHAWHWTPEGVSDHLLLLLDLWPPYGSMPQEADAIGPLSRLILLYPSTCVYPGKGTHKRIGCSVFTYYITITEKRHECKQVYVWKLKILIDEWRQK